MSHPKRARNAEIYDRTFVTGELSDTQSPRIHGITPQRVNQIMQH